MYCFKHRYYNGLNNTFGFTNNHHTIQEFTGEEDDIMQSTDDPVETFYKLFEKVVA